MPTLTLTFDAGANAWNIYKLGLFEFSTSTTGTNALSADTTYALNNLGSSNSYTANLIFNGVNTVAGNTEIDFGTITINGGPVVFAGRVESGDIYVNGGNVSFNGDVDLESLAGPDHSIIYGAANQVTFQGGADLTGNVNFGGHNGTLNLGTGSDVDGDVVTSGYQSGTINFAGNSRITGDVGGSGTLALLQANGVSGTVVQIDGLSKAETLNLNSGTVALGGGIDTRRQDSTLGTVNFGNYDGTVQIGHGSSLIGSVVTTANNKGTLTMVSGTQDISGNVGASGAALKTLNIGGANTGGIDTDNAAFSTTTIDGDVFAQSTVLNNNGSTNSSTLNMASGHNLTSTVTTTDADMGILTLQGGTQTVSGSVGVTGARLAEVNSGANGATSNFSSNVFARTVSNTGAGSTAFASNVTATNAINVNAGTTTIAGTATVDGDNGSINVTSGSLTVTGATSLTGTDLSINVGSGTATFNGTTNITTGDVNFTSNGIVNFNQDAAFTNLNFVGNAATVNVASGKNVTATAITNATTTNGTLVMQGGAQTVNAAIGATGPDNNLLLVEAGADAAVTNFTNIAAMHTETLNVTGNGTVNLSGGLVGNLSYTNNVASENGTVVVSSGKDIIGTVTTGSNGTNNAGSQGILTLSGGPQQVSGPIGTSTAALTRIDAGATGGTATLNGMVYADTLQYTGNGTVILNGINGATGGLKGTVDFGTNNTNTGTLQIGDGVNLTTGSTGIQFVDANGASLRFNGDSTVTGELGGDTTGRSTFKEIHAGADGKIVTFTDDVHVMEGSSVPATFYVSGTGTVNFQGDLNGDLVYNQDGTVNVSNGKSIIVTTAPVAVTTNVNNSGTLNFLGSTTLGTDIGENLHKLKAVTFNSASNNVTQTINKNIYATDVTIGGVAGTTAIAKQDVTGQFDYAGATQMSAFTGGTTANVTANVTLGGNLTLANDTTALNVGTSHITVGNNLDTNGAAMSFTVNTQDVTGVNDAVSTSSGSGQIVATGNLTMTGTEKVHVNYVGSLANSGTYNLIESAGGTAVNATANTTVAGRYNRTEGDFVSDNSFSIDSRVYTNDLGDLIVAADRTGGSTYASDQLYVVKSNTVGHFSNNAAAVIAGIAAAGSQSGDMIEVIQKLEIDSFGYGNNAANLATQVQRLAPVANASVTQPALAAAQLPLTATGTRMSSLRGDTLAASSDLTGISAGGAANQNGIWVKGLGAKGTQKHVGAYDGYNVRTAGLAVGYDTRIGNGNTIIGLALGHTDSKVKQADFRSGDNTKIRGYQAIAYASHDIDQNLYVEGALTLVRNDYDASRRTAIDRVAKADFKGTQTSANVGLGYRIPMADKLTLTPMASLNFTRLKQDSYSETGAGALNLNVDQQTLNRTRLTLGARLTKDIENNGSLFRPELDMAFYHDSGDLKNDVTAAFQGGGAAFTTPTAGVSKSGYNLGLGLTVMADKRTSVQVRYDHEGRKGFTGHTGSLVGRWAF